MNKVAIVGTGQTKFSKDDSDIEKLLFDMFWGSGGIGSRLWILPRPQRTSQGGFQTT